MALKISFTTEESVDGTYITVTDTTGVYNVASNPTGWGAPNTEMSAVTHIRLILTFDTATYYYVFTQTGVDIAELAGGIDIGIEDISGLTGSTFEDGSYGLALEIDTGAGYDTTHTYTNEYTEGFAAVITGTVMTNALSYRVYLDYDTKDGILEQMRLLNNLAYSAEIGSTTAFEENLSMLQDITA